MQPIHQFDQRDRLPSCEISKDSLDRIERYLLGDVQALLGVPPEHLETEYSLEIEDSLGKETISSIAHFRPHQFTNSTKAINVRLRSHVKYSSRVQYNTFRRLSVTLGFETTDARIAIECESTAPREIVSGIYDAIKRLLEPHKTVNWLFYPHLAIDFLLPMFVGALITAFIIFLQKDLTLYALLSGAVAVGLTLYAAVGKKTHPFTTFESRRSKAFAKFIEWFLLGILGFLIFGTLLTKLRQNFFGF